MARPLGGCSSEEAQRIPGLFLDIHANFPEYAALLPSYSLGPATALRLRVCHRTNNVSAGAGYRPLPPKPAPNGDLRFKLQANLLITIAQFANAFNDDADLAASLY